MITSLQSPVLMKALAVAVGLIACFLLYCGRNDVVDGSRLSRRGLFCQGSHHLWSSANGNELGLSLAVRMAVEPC